VTLGVQGVKKRTIELPLASYNQPPNPRINIPSSKPKNVIRVPL
jgi:hypothetical protein